jgi:hypothetical protein
MLLTHRTAERRCHVSLGCRTCSAVGMLPFLSAQLIADMTLGMNSREEPYVLLGFCSRQKSLKA